MPTYEYVCDACEHEFEEFQSMSAKHLKKCPACGKNKLRRLIGTGAGIIFKGSGFYETDYRGDGYKKDQKADSEKKTEKKSDSKSDKTSKTDKKSDEKPKAEKSEPKKENKNN